MIDRQISLLSVDAVQECLWTRSLRSGNMTVYDCLDWFYMSKGDLSDKAQILWLWLFALPWRMVVGLYK